MAAATLLESLKNTQRAMENIQDFVEICRDIVQSWDSLDGEGQEITATQWKEFYLSLINPDLQNQVIEDMHQRYLEGPYGKHMQSEK